MRKIFVSACLWGENCKYNGGNNLRESLQKELEGCEVVLVCPECMGGLSTPRTPSEIEKGFDGTNVVTGKGRVINSAGEEVTEQFLNGAVRTLELAKEHMPEKIYLKQGSPSCGFGKIYDGTFSGTKKQGDGVTAALLKKHGFNVIAVE